MFVMINKILYLKKREDDGTLKFKIEELETDELKEIKSIMINII